MGGCEAEGPIIEVVSRRPCGSLASYVDRYVGYRMEGFSGGIHRGVPRAGLTVLVSFGDPIEVVGRPDGSSHPLRLRTMVGGIQNRATMVRHNGRQAGVAIELTVSGARALFGCPSSELTGLVVDMAEMLGRPAADLPGRLVEAAGWPERFRVLDEFLLSSTERHRCPPALSPGIVQAHQCWSRSEVARLDVSSMARELGWGRRHFTDLFAREVGVPPRQFLRLVRFERCATMLSEDPSRSLGALAEETGFYDQAHMCRDWREFAGLAPSEWVRREDFPEVRVDG